MYKEEACTSVRPFYFSINHEGVLKNMNIVLQQSPVKIDRFLPYPEGLPPLDSFSEIHCNLSGGNDSTAALLYMLYGYNIPKEKIVLFHARVDGPPE